MGTGRGRFCGDLEVGIPSTVATGTEVLGGLREVNGDRNGVSWPGLLEKDLKRKLQASPTHAVCLPKEKRNENTKRALTDALVQVMELSEQEAQEVVVKSNAEQHVLFVGAKQDAEALAKDFSNANVVVQVARIRKLGPITGGLDQIGTTRASGSPQEGGESQTQQGSDAKLSEDE
jgi:hypothetical protein